MSPHDTYDCHSFPEDPPPSLDGFVDVRPGPPNLNETVEGRQSGTPSTLNDTIEGDVDDDDDVDDGDEGVEDSQMVEQVTFTMHPRFGTDFYYAHGSAYGPAPACFVDEIIREVQWGEDSMAESILVHVSDSEPQSIQSSGMLDAQHDHGNTEMGHHGDWIHIDHETEDGDDDAELRKELDEMAAGRVYRCRCQCGGASRFR